MHSRARAFRAARMETTLAKKIDASFYPADPAAPVYRF
jgi:hypothetical protein